MPLSDDQRAMLRLLAQREQGYEDIAALMGLSVAEVRAKVGEALGQLEAEGVAPPPLPPEPTVTEPETPKEPEPVETAPPATPVEPAAPKIEETPPPAATKKAPAPSKPAPARATKGPASRPKLSLPADRGPRTAIAAGLAAVVVLVIVLIVGGGDGGSSNNTSSTPTAASGGSQASEEEALLTAVENNPKLTKAILAPVDGGEGSGLAIFGKVKKAVILQIQAKGLTPSPKGSTYTVWLYKSPKLALRVGSVVVPKSGGIGAQFPIPAELLAYVASGAFNQVDISLTPTAAYNAEVTKAKKAKTLPAYTGTDILRGEITGPAIKTGS